MLHFCLFINDAAASYHRLTELTVHLSPVAIFSDPPKTLAIKYLPLALTAFSLLPPSHASIHIHKGTYKFCCFPQINHC